MKETLESLQRSLSALQTEAFSDLQASIEKWLGQMESIKYACLGCKYCFPAVAMNVFHKAFSEVCQSLPLNGAFAENTHCWPLVAGEYDAFCDGPGFLVAVSTLACIELAERLARVRVRELCIVGKTETENIGIEKIIKNIVSNPTIRFLLLAGREPKGHQSGRSLFALWENGVDKNMRIVGTPGKRPILKNVSQKEVETVRRQVVVVNMIGCDDEERIIQKIRALSRRLNRTCNGEESAVAKKPVRISQVSVIHAKEPSGVVMDRAGYFVIFPQPEKQRIVVEHYAYDNTLQRIIEGRDARSLYWTIITNGWVTQLTHAAYLGKELTKAELSIKMGFKYIQDGA